MFLALLALGVAAPRPTVVLIHGAGGGGWEWDKWRPVFARAGWNVVAPDLMPKGGDLAKTRFEDYVAQVKAWCPKRGPFVIVGASMGGILALKTAEQVRASGLVLVNGVPPAGTGGKSHPAVVRWANGPLKDTRDSMPDSDEKTILWAWPKWRDESGAVLDKISAGVTVKKPTVPVLVVTGTSDTDILPTLQQTVVDAYGADHLVYHGMSHVGPLMSRRAEEVAEAVLTWARATVRRAGS